MVIADDHLKIYSRNGKAAGSPAAPRASAFLQAMEFGIFVGSHLSAEPILLAVCGRASHGKR